MFLLLPFRLLDTVYALLDGLFPVPGGVSNKRDPNRRKNTLDENTFKCLRYIAGGFPLMLLARGSRVPHLIS